METGKWKHGLKPVVQFLVVEFGPIHLGLRLGRFLGEPVFGLWGSWAEDLYWARNRGSMSPELSGPCSPTVLRCRGSSELVWVKLTARSAGFLVLGSIYQDSVLDAPLFAPRPYWRCAPNKSLSKRL